ncbi:hypothetical protein [Shewanella surugensis]|uniref:GlyGly-CTERM sorting domain-containing protein n=1 Tax=Shewanella surugensis TaxID=212020 RepID=A0ABT0LK79_9GAMM|nr:hypothetical protein [Shewanella surugensis]MCL1127692.1 hypothetical protein [Shewanella surugensis]
MRFSGKEAKGDIETSIEDDGGGSGVFSMVFWVFRILRASGSKRPDQNRLMSGAKA